MNDCVLCAVLFVDVGSIALVSLVSFHFREEVPVYFHQHLLRVLPPARGCGHAKRVPTVPYIIIDQVSNTVPKYWKSGPLSLLSLLSTPLCSSLCPSLSHSLSLSLSEFDDHFPVVDVAVSTSKTEEAALTAKGFKVVHGNVNTNTWFGKKVNVWYKKGGADDFASDAEFLKACVTDITVASRKDAKALVADGFICVQRNLKQGHLFAKNL